MPRRVDPMNPDFWWRRQPDPTMRVGDAERNEVADALSQHFSAGRLDDQELKERLDRAMSAKTGADLAGLLDDLPPLTAPPPPPPAPRGRGRGLGWVAVAAVSLALLSLPWHYVPWLWVPHVPWLLIGIVGVVLWRRSRRRRWHRGEMRA